MNHIKGIAHAAYAVSDMQKSLTFYCEKLGMAHAFSIADDEGRPWIEYLKVAPGQFVELFYAKDAPGPNGSYLHLCLLTDDCVQTAKELEEAGVDVYAKPCRGKDANWQCWVRDPDGNPIEIMQIVPDSPQARA